MGTRRHGLHVRFVSDDALRTVATHADGSAVRAKKFVIGRGPNCLQTQKMDSPKQHTQHTQHTPHQPLLGVTKQTNKCTFTRRLGRGCKKNPNLQALIVQVLSACADTQDVIRLLCSLDAEEARHCQEVVAGWCVERMLTPTNCGSPVVSAASPAT